MPSAKAQIAFIRVSDAATLMRQCGGCYRPAQSKTDIARLDAFSHAEIERMATNDPDQPALDDAFWAGVEDHPLPKEAISIKLDGDILSYFRGQGRGYQTRINAVLRRYVDSRLEKRS